MFIQQQLVTKKLPERLNNELFVDQQVLFMYNMYLH